MTGHRRAAPAVLAAIVAMTIALMLALSACGGDPAASSASMPSSPAAPTATSTGSSAPPAHVAAPDADPGAAASGSDDTDEDAADRPGACGSAVCTPDHFCEDRYKGHATDGRGRPLERRKCMPLPAPCTASPTCACVTKHVASTHCTDSAGRVYLNDYPVRR